jgi:hypothetical protein
MTHYLIQKITFPWRNGTTESEKLWREQGSQLYNVTRLAVDARLGGRTHEALLDEKGHCVDGHSKVLG